MEKSDMKWRTLNSDYIIRRPWLTARRDTVELPNSTINDEYYVLEYPDWINVIATTTEDKFVLIRQYRHAIGLTCHEIVAGVIEKGEQPEEAARRELLEETGFGGGTWHKLMSIAPNASTSTNYTHCLVATGVEKQGTQHLDPTEDIEVCLMSRNELYNLLEGGEIIQATMAAPLWRYFAENR